MKLPDRKSVSKVVGLIPALEAGIPGDPGIIDPDSIVREVVAKKIVAIASITAELLQIAHPKIAAEVASCRRYATDPLGRLIDRLDFLLVACFGDSEQAKEAGAKVRGKHAPVRAVLGEDIGQWSATDEYTAWDPDLNLWIFATLIEPTLDLYSQFYPFLGQHQRADFYYDSWPIAELMGVPEGLLPPNYEDFRTYYRIMLRSLVVSDRALKISRALFAANLEGIPVSPTGPIVAAALLPTPELRAGFQLKWGPFENAAWAGIQAVANSTLRHASAESAVWPHAEVARGRCLA